MVKAKTKMFEGVCGKCGSEDIDYGTLIPEGESLYYESQCNECGVFMHEWYDLTYSGTDVMIEDDEDKFASVEYLQEGDVILNERED
tara:strand:+ start:908 stop:1168 length:261 start_codon:yes stop_codon:yes gene_type:complete